MNTKSQIGSMDFDQEKIAIDFIWFNINYFLVSKKSDPFRGVILRYSETMAILLDTTWNVIFK